MRKKLSNTLIIGGFLLASFGVFAQNPTYILGPDTVDIGITYEYVLPGWICPPPDDQNYEFSVAPSNGVTLLKTADNTWDATFSFCGTYTISGLRPCQNQTTGSITTVVVGPKPDPPVASDDQTICQGETVTLSANGCPTGTIAWYSGSCGDILENTGTLFSSGPIVASTTFYARCEDPCDSSDCDSVIIEVIPLDNPNFTYNDFCVGSIGVPSAIATGGGIFSFAPDPMDGSNIDSDDGEIHNAISGATYNVQYLTTGTCTDSMVVAVNVSTAADPAFTYPNFCEGTTGIPSNIVSAGGVFSFNPDPIDGATIDSNDGEIHMAVSGSAYTVQYKTGGTCPDSTTVVVNIIGLDDATFTYPNFCEGTTGSPSNIVSAGGVFSFNPDPIDGATIDGNDGEIHNGQAGALYSVLYTTAGICTTSFTLNVNVIPLSDPSFSYNDFCENAIGVPSGIVNGGGLFSFAPNPMDGASINPISGAINGAMAGSFYPVSYTTGGACPSSDTLMVEIIAREDAGFVYPNFCSAITGQPLSTNTPGGVFSFNPDPMDGATIDGNNGQINDGQAGGVYSVKYTVAGTCPNSSTVAVTVTGLDDPSFSLADYCQNAPQMPFNIISPGGVFSFAIDLGDGANINPATGLITGGLGGNTYTVRYVSSGVCADSMDLPVTVHAMPEANFTANDVCQGLMASFTDVSSIDVGIIDTWQWNFDDGSPQEFVQNPNHLYPAVGVYNVQLTVSSNQGCQDDTTLKINVLPGPQANFYYDYLCTGQFMHFQSTSSIDIGGQIAQYYWILDGDTLSVAENPNLTINPQGNYNLSLHVVSDDGCVNSISKNIEVHKSPSASLFFLDSMVCEGECVKISYQITQGDGNVALTQFLDGTNLQPLNANSIEICDNTSDFTGMSLFVIDDNGCSDTARLNSSGQWLPNPIAYIDVNQTYFSTPPAEITLNSQSLLSDSVSWSKNQTHHSSNNSVVEIIEEEGTIHYVLEAFNEIGCSSKDSVTIVIDPGYTLFVPNTITLNEDGLNENFNAQGLGLVEEEFELIIFDRWGDVIFKTKNLNQGWNGTFQKTGKLVKQDVYVYTVQVKTITNQTLHLTGKVHVIK